MIVKRVGFRHLKKDWIELEKNPSIYPYQYYKLIRVLKKRYAFYSLRRKEIPTFYAAYDGSTCVAIFPLCRVLFSGGKQFVTMGASASMQTNDAVYSETLTRGQMVEILRLLIQEVGTVAFRFIPEESLLCKALMEVTEPTGKNENVKISAALPYDSYYASLSKNTRQNIRTAYNRMAADGYSYELETFTDPHISSAELQKLMDVYIARRRSHYEDVSLLREWILRHYHFNTAALSKLPNSMYAILKINGEIAAFWGGYTDHANYRVLIPRLAINDKFQRYSPGAVLINESMKIMRPEFGLSMMDLSAGGEQYKYSMGGETYLTYNFCLSKAHIGME